MAKLTKKRIAWLIIIIIVGFAVGLNMWKGKQRTGPVHIPRTPKEIFEGEVREKGYKQRFVAGDRDASDKIVIVNVQGEITNARWGFSYRRGMVDELINQLKQAEKDEYVKAIILNINSPGGPVIDADILYTKIRELGKKKIIISLLDKMAASGGYYVACAAHKIVAHPLTLTGNIGVIMDFINLQGLLEKKLGIEMGVIKSGRYKDIGSPYRSMDRNEKKMLQDLVDAAHQRFVEKVAAGRNISVVKLAPLADGRIFSGEQARQVGLVDELGTQDEAIELAKKLSGVERAKVVEYYFRPRLWDFLSGKISDYLKVKEVSSIPEPTLEYIWHPSFGR
ncbi:hypothetical protein AUJ66_04590 [Candidatus Desantisbacteria bacterium CG1_02_38_46]|nr:MAG: hypothetical protein AUJ66_04590 [Candidatus Desantisbacteria bacterium CG1_02_38_46]